MSFPGVSNKFSWTVAALVGLAMAISVAPAMSADRLQEREIVPGKSIGNAALGMTRATIQRRLKSPIPPRRTHDNRFYSLIYRYPYRGDGNSGDKLIIVFHGLSRGARAVYMATVEPTLSTRPEDVGVYTKLTTLEAYFNVNCYHSNNDGSRDENIENNENFECELRRNGGFSYFSFASYDADPRSRILAVAVAVRRVD